MVAFVVALSTKSIKELGDPVPSARTSVPVAKFTVGEKCLVYVGALTLQFFVLYLASLTTGHGFSYLEFWNIFQQRFTKGATTRITYILPNAVIKVAAQRRILSSSTRCIRV
jgi:hypothetical protein